MRPGRQTVKLGLIKVIHDLFPEETLKTSYSILEGIFCTLAGSALSVREVRQIGLKLQDWVKKNQPIQFICKNSGYYHYKVDDIKARVIYPAYVSPAMAEPFVITPFSHGFIVDFAVPGQGITEPVAPPFHLSATFEKYQRWMNNINVELVSDVNSYINSGQSLKLLSIAEALHEKEISDISDVILQQRRALRVLLIAGPSSSGKTSFAQRLSTQLQVNGLNPVPLFLDDYFLDRSQTPRDEQGNYDFDCPEALDLELLHDHIEKLIGEETIEAPAFDFLQGCRSKETKTICVGPGDILIIEGIHALNPRLVTGINKNHIYKVYLSALGGLNIDFMNRIPTTDARLIRRLVRDDRFRGTDPEKTFNQWPSVRKSEYENIFRFQEEADVMFNSSMLYEMNALRPFAEASLEKTGEDSPFYECKERIMNLLSFFEPMDVAKVPYNSIIREFIGGSIYFC